MRSKSQSDKTLNIKLTNQFWLDIYFLPLPFPFLICCSVWFSNYGIFKEKRSSGLTFESLVAWSVVLIFLLWMLYLSVLFLFYQLHQHLQLVHHKIRPISVAVREINFLSQDLSEAWSITLIRFCEGRFVTNCLNWQELERKI